MRVYYLGGVLIAASILGGGTSKFLSSEFILQLLILPGAIWLLYKQIPKDPPYLITVMVLILGVVSAPIILSASQGMGHSLGTLSVGRSLDSTLFVISMLAVFWFAVSLTEVQRARVAQFFLIAVVINFAFSLIQFSAKSPETTIALFPYSVTAGFFENERHLSSLLFVAIPFVILAFKNTSWFFLSVPLALVLSLYQFVLGSVIGVFIGLTCLLASLAAIEETRSIKISATVAAAIGGAGLVYFVPDLLEVQTSDGVARTDLFQRALGAIWNYWPYGSGFGTFPLVYPPFGSPAGTNLSFASHAYNDYLELVVEGGVLVSLSIIAYVVGVVIVAARGGLSNLQKTALLGIVVLLIHSGVDYPLRTMTMAMVFAYLNALYLGPVLSAAPARN